MERRLAKGLEVVATLYHYRLRDLIQGIADADGTTLFQNISSTHATGAEFELGGRPLDWLHFAGSWSVQRAADADEGFTAVNSPRNMAKFRAAVPVFTDKLHFTGAFRYLSARESWAGATIDPVSLTDK